MQQRDGMVMDVRGLSKFFPAGGGKLFGLGGERRMVHAVEDISFTVGRGQILALVGESGSGKSTVARLLAGLYPATAGQALFNGQDVLKLRGRRAMLRYRGRVQMVFQDPFGSLNPVKTVAHHLERPLVIHGQARGRGVRERVHELLRVVGLTPAEEVAAKYPHQLSGGQRQRVSFARALSVDPELILADEPISMLDVSIRMGILNLMAQLREERGLSYLYITHDLVYHARPRQRALSGRRDPGALRRPSDGSGAERGADGRAAAPLYSAAAERRARSRQGLATTAHRSARRDPDRYQPGPGLPLRQPLSPHHGDLPPPDARPSHGPPRPSRALPSVY